VQVTAAGTLTTYTTGPTDTVGRLLDANGTELASNDDFTDLNFRIVRAVSAGTYYISVRHFSSTSTGSYALRVEFSTTTTSPDDHGNTTATATAVTVGSSTNGVMNTSDDVDYFRVQLTGSGTLTVYSTGSMDTVGSLLDSNGTVLATNDDYTDLNFRIVRSVAAGTYYISVRGYGGQTGSYVLRVEFSGAPTTTDDHGNTASSATAVNLNSSTNGAINSPGDVDFFRVQVTATGTLTLTTTGTTDTYGRLLDANGVELASNDDYTDLNFRIVHTVTAGTYYISVRHYSPTETGAYVLRVDFSAGTSGGGGGGGTTGDDHGNTAGTATPVNVGSSTNGAINTPGDIDFFRVQVTGSGTLTVFTTGSTDTYGRLLDANGVELAANDDYADLNFRITRAVSAGTYYISVRHFSSGSTGAYVLRVEFTGAVTDDHGNTISAATAVSLNSSTNGAIDSAGDVDFFRVQVTGAGTLTVFTTGSTDTVGTLYNSSGTMIASNDDAQDLNFRISQAVSAGTYFVSVRHFSSGSTGAYVLRVEFTGGGGGGGSGGSDDHGNTTATATAVSLPSTTNGTIGSPGDLDYFRVQVSAAGTLVAYTTGSTDTYGRLLDSNGVELASNDDSTDLNFRIARAVAAGTYFVEVRHYSPASTGAYALRVEFSSSASDDHGNTTGTATAVNLNSSTNGAINAPGDVDYFRVQVTDAGTLTVFTTGSTDTYGRLLDSNGVELASNDDATDLNFRISRTVTAGTYYVAVRHYSSSATGAYVLRVDFAGRTATPTTDDHGDTRGTATSISAPSSTNGAINSAGDLDYFRVQVGSATTLVIYTTGSTDTYGRLLDSSGAELASNDDATDLNFRIVRSLGAGTYFIEVRHYSPGGTGAYVLRVEAPAATSTSDDHGNSTSSATAVNTPSSTNGSINYPGDIDFFRVQVSGAGSLSIFTTGSTDTYGRLLDSSGAELASNDDSNDLNFRIIRTVSAGTYYVSVRHFSSEATGAYVLRVEFSATATPADDHGNTAATAAAVNLNSSTNAAIDVPGDVDFFRVQVTEAGTLTVYTTGSTDTFGRLLDSNGVELASNDDSTDLNFRIVRAVSPGVYYVSVRHYSSASTGAYVLRVDFTAGGSSGTTDDHGNTTATATAVNIGSSTNGAINAPGDVDFFRVQVSGAGNLTVFTTGSTDTYGRLLDSNGVELASNDDSTDLNFRINRTVSAGTYYVSVRHYSSSLTGAYVLRVDFTASGAGGSAADDHGNTADTATAVNLNSTTNGAINFAGDVDFFRVQMSGAGTLLIYTTGSTDTYGRLLNSSGVELARNDDSSDLNFRISHSVGAGTYYVSVRHYSSTGTGAYVLRVEQIASGANTAYTVEIDAGGSRVVPVGTPQTIAGRILRGGNPVPNADFGVVDGLERMSRAIRTDANGRFSFTSTPRRAQAAVVEFTDGRSLLLAVGYQVVNSQNSAGSVFADSFAVRNASTRSLRVIVTNPYSESYEVPIQAGETRTVVTSRRTSGFSRVEVTAGVGVDFGVAGVSSTVSTSGTLTTTYTAGVLLIRGSAYFNSEGDWGVCWSPGQGGGAGEVSGQLCVGTDGLSVGADATVGVLTSGFSIRVMQW
jgi:hypothetical protein